MFPAEVGIVIVLLPIGRVVVTGDDRSRLLKLKKFKKKYKVQVSKVKCKAQCILVRSSINAKLLILYLTVTVPPPAEAGAIEIRFPFGDNCNAKFPVVVIQKLFVHGVVLKNLIRINFSL